MMLPTTGISMLMCMLALADPQPVGPADSVGAPLGIATDAVVLAEHEVTTAELAESLEPVESGAIATPTELATPLIGFVPIFLTAFQAPAAARPPFVYGPGAYGYGYYAAPGTQPASTTRSTTTVAATGATRGRSSNSRGRYREFGSGRGVRLAKPWLRQFD